jgi:nucleolar pre-ribosomal-associated protein 1
VFRGTTTVSDRRLFAIFQRFEVEQKISVASLLATWNSSEEIPSANALEAIQSLDPSRVLRTCLSFPKQLRLDDLANESSAPDLGQIYEPMFLVLLFACMLSDCPPDSAFAWVELFRTNIVSLLIRALSAKDDTIRELALCQIVGMWQCLEVRIRCVLLVLSLIVFAKGADMQEKPHVMYILSLLMNTLPSPSQDPPRRLPTYASLILLHALRAVFYPSDFIFPHTSRFLLQRPELDTQDVPLLYSMLYSSSDDWRKGRMWIIRCLTDGMIGTDDWRILKRRHTWELLASLFQTLGEDKTTRTGILKVSSGSPLCVRTLSDTVTGTWKSHLQLPSDNVAHPQVRSLVVDRIAAPQSEGG